MERKEKLSNFWEKMRILKILLSVAYGGGNLFLNIFLIEIQARIKQ